MRLALAAYMGAVEGTEAKMANSIWFRDDGTFEPNRDFLADCASFAGAEVFAREFDAETCSDLNAWVSEHTDGMIEDILDEIPSDAVMYLVNALAFEADWASEYQEHQVRDGVFHAEDGDKTAQMMYGDEQTYLSGEGFTGFMKPYKGGRYAFAALLPDEGVTPEALLSDGSAVDFFLSPESAESKYMTIDLSVPKFDVSADTDLSGALRALGVTDVFDAGKADFSPLTDKADDIFLSQAKHSARVTIDEEGVVAAAYTVMVACGAALPPDERVEFTLDRPFLFAVTGESGEILFAGIVNTPA